MTKTNIKALSRSALVRRYQREACKGKEAARMTREQYIKREQDKMINSWFIA